MSDSLSFLVKQPGPAPLTQEEQRQAEEPRPAVGLSCHLVARCGVGRLVS